MSGIVGEQATAGGFSHMLSLLADPALLQQRLAEFESSRQQAAEAIALVGPAQDIPRLHADALEDRRVAAELLAAARRDADVLRATAAREVQQTRAQAQASAEQILREAAEQRTAAQLAAQAADDKLRELEERGRALEVSEAAAAEAAAAAATAQSNADTAQAALADKLSRLQNLLAYVGTKVQELER